MIFAIIEARIGTDSLITALIESYKRNYLKDNMGRDIYKSSDTFIASSIVAFAVGASHIMGAFVMWLVREDKGNESTIGGVSTVGQTSNITNN